MVNSGAWSAPRSRLRQTWEKAKMRVSPAASSFFIANSGLVCRNIRRAAPASSTAAVAKAWRCASFPGETWSAAGSTSVKPSAANQSRKAAWMRLRASSTGRRSACRALSHHVPVPLILPPRL
jgi:hypothetical protein